MARQINFHWYTFTCFYMYFCSFSTSCSSSAVILLWQRVKSASYHGNLCFIRVESSNRAAYMSLESIAVLQSCEWNIISHDQLKILSSFYSPLCCQFQTNMTYFFQRKTKLSPWCFSKYLHLVSTDENKSGFEGNKSIGYQNGHFWVNYIHDYHISCYWAVIWLWKCKREVHQTSEHYCTIYIFMNICVETVFSCSFST